LQIIYNLSLRSIMKVQLYVNVSCPFARRGMLTALVKAVETELIPIPLAMQLKVAKANGIEALPTASTLWPGKTFEDLEEIKENYKRDINSTGEVPTLVLRHDDSSKDVVSEADVVAEYLEDAFPDSGVSLLPRDDALARSRVRHYLKTLNGDNGVLAMYGLLMNQDPEKDALLRDKIYKGLSEYVRLASPMGPFFLGETLSLADVLLIPMWDQFRFLVPHYRGVDFIPEDDVAFPWAARMRNWATAVEGLDSFKACRLDKDAYIRLYAGYAGARNVSQFGGQFPGAAVVG